MSHTAKKSKVKLAQKLANLQKALKEYTDFCEQIRAENKLTNQKEIETK